MNPESCDVNGESSIQDSSEEFVYLDGKDSHVELLAKQVRPGVYISKVKPQPLGDDADDRSWRRKLINRYYELRRSPFSRVAD